MTVLPFLAQNPDQTDKLKTTTTTLAQKEEKSLLSPFDTIPLPINGIVGCSKREKSFFEKFRDVAGYMEIVFFVHGAALQFARVMVKDVLLDKACRVNLNFSQTVCNQLRGGNQSLYEDEEAAAQQYVSSIQSWSTVLDHAFPPICLLLLGAWSDIHGRKFPVLFALFGFILRYLGLLLSLYFQSWTAETVALINSLPVSITGRGESIRMALFSYIADTSTADQRTFRMSVVSALRISARTLGSMVAAILINFGASPATMFLLAGSMDLFCFLYTLVVLRNTKARPKKIIPAATASETAKVNLVNDGNKKNKSWNRFIDIFNIKNALKSIKTALRKRNGNLRFQLMSLIVVIFFTGFPPLGEEVILYLYARYKFKWSVAHFGFFNSYSALTSFVGVLITTGLLHRVLKLSDPILGIFACCSRMASSIVYAFASHSWMMYLAPFVGMFSGTMSIYSRSMVSQIVDADEVGTVNGFIGLVEAFSHLPSGSVYSTLYKATLSTSFPGGAFMVTTGVAMASMSIYGLNGFWLAQKRKNKFQETMDHV